MDDVVNRLSRELADAMAAAVADDHRVEACHEKARAAGYNMKVSIEAVIGFSNRPKPDDGMAKAGVALAKTESVPEAGAMSSNDRRFLRSLRIAADDGGRQADGGLERVSPLKAKKSEHRSQQAE